MREFVGRHLRSRGRFKLARISKRRSAVISHLRVWRRGILSFEILALSVHSLAGVGMTTRKLETQTQNRKLTMSIFEEFREFAFKGNVIDLAVGVIIGAAFGKIVTSLVN